MTTRTKAPRNACEPPVPPAGPTVVVATDYDRTFTQSNLKLDPRALLRTRQLRKAGTRLILCTGRTAADLPMADLRGCFDEMVLEGGAVWGKPGQWNVAPTTSQFWDAAKHLAGEGHDVQEGWASYSIPASVQSPQAAIGPTASLAVNHDRIDVTPAGYDKGRSLAACIESLGLVEPWVLVVGDGPNDVSMARHANATVAVANAAPELVAIATCEAPYAAHRGFLWAVSRLGRRPSPSSEASP